MTEQSELQWSHAIESEDYELAAEIRARYLADLAFNVEAENPNIHLSSN